MYVIIFTFQSIDLRELFVDCTSLKTTGVACDGTFAEYVVASMNHVTPIPDALDSVSATAIMCAVRQFAYFGEPDSNDLLPGCHRIQCSATEQYALWRLGCYSRCRWRARPSRYAPLSFVYPSFLFLRLHQPSNMPS